MAIQVACKCGKKFNLKNEYAGKAIKCPSCSEVIKVNQNTMKSATKPDSQDGIGDLLDEVDLTATAGHHCPDCRTSAAEDAIICVQCGYNFNTGRKMKTKKVQDRSSLFGKRKQEH